MRSSRQAFVAARFSAFVMPSSKRGAGESQIINPLGVQPLRAKDATLRTELAH